MIHQPSHNSQLHFDNLCFLDKLSLLIKREINLIISEVLDLLFIKLLQFCSIKPKLIPFTSQIE
jgi:hypothetical protein